MGYEAPKRILVIDDDVTMNTIICSYLKAAGLDAYMAVSEEQAVNQVRAVRPQAIVLDRHLGQMDGTTLLTKIRDLPGFRDIPVLMLTGETRKDEVKKAIDLGVNDYLAKPFSPDDLLKKVKKLMQEKESP